MTVTQRQLPPSRPVLESKRFTSKDADPDTIHNLPAEGFSFFTPKQLPSPGTSLDAPSGHMPKLFTPLTIRGITLPNRLWVSPMCQYSAHEGFHQPWHFTHYGAFVQRGPGLTMIEATAVQARGRNSPEDSGLWLDAHVEGLRKHVEFAHSQNALIGIQLGHAGRKASTVALWLSFGAIATEAAGGWPEDVIGPSDEPFAPAGFAKPRAMTIQEIKTVKADFVAAARRAVAAGFDVIELHFAHGYLVSSFLSPAVNKRTDEYGGSFENRARLALEIVEEVRATIPEQMPLFVRVSATDWLEGEHYEGESWTIQDSVRFADLLADQGVDVLDVSSGGTHSSQRVQGAPGYQALLAKEIKRAVGDKMLVTSVGEIKTGAFAEELLVGGKDENDTSLDLIAAGRMFLQNPGLAWAWAEELDTTIQVAHQIGWPSRGRGASRK